MLNIRTLVFALFSLAFVASAQSDSLAPLSPFSKFADPTQGILAVQTAYEVERGTIKVIAYDNRREAYLEEPVAKLVGTLDDTGLAVFKLTEDSVNAISSGYYAFVVFHDRDENGHLNMNLLGKPTEPYIFSNNVKPKLSKPSFEKTKVVVGPGEVIVVTLH